MNRSFKVLAVLGLIVTGVFLQSCDFLDLPKKTDPTERGGIQPAPPAMIFHNKLGSPTEISNSIVGPGGQTYGNVSYSLAKFGNGLTCDAIGPEYAQFNLSAIDISISSGTVEFWFKPNFTLMTGPGFGTGDQAAVPFLINTNKNTVFMAFDLTQGGFSGAFCGVDPVRVCDTITTWAPGNIVHIALVWDKARFSGGKTMAIYVNGVMTGSVTNTLLLQEGVRYFDAVHVGNAAFGGSYNDMPVMGTMDNIKIYNYAKTDFSDRFTE